MERAGVRHVAAEISSIGIEEGRVDELSFRACVFTNLGRDHLDYHGTIENYFAAKLRLFTEIMPRSRRGTPVAIVRGDDPFGRRVLAAVRGDKLSFGSIAPRRSSAELAAAGIDGIRARDQRARASNSKSNRRCSARSICSTSWERRLCRWPWASKRMRWWRVCGDAQGPPADSSELPGRRE